MIKNILRISALCAVCLFLCAASCKKEPLPGGGSSSEQEDPTPAPDPDDGKLKIAGTVIKEGNNLVGLILDGVAGTPIEGVPVTDGFTWTLTDRHGVYQFVAHEDARQVYYSLPAGYDFAVSKTSNLPLFYSTKKIVRSEVNRNDFKLMPRARKTEEFAFSLFGDIHIKNQTTLATFRSKTLAQMKDYLDQNFPSLVRFGITQGDVIDNCYSGLWPDIKAALGNVQMANGSYLPFYNCIGNHDHDCTLGTRDVDFKGGFVSAFGPTDYSFNVGDVHFVVMDNFEGTGKSGTSSTSRLTAGDPQISQSQYEWLKKDLEMVADKDKKMVVLVEHCQLRGFTTRPYYNEMLTLLTQFYDAYVFSGHAHISESYKFTSFKTKSGEPVKEHIHNVPMGNFWLSPYGPDGAPAGFYVYKVKGNKFESWEYRAVDKPDDQMRLYDSTDKYISDDYRWSLQQPFDQGNYLLAHIYNGDEDWTVTFEHDGKSEYMTFYNTRFTDYCISSYNANSVKLSLTYKYYWDKSENWWYIKLDKPISQMASGWKVKAVAKFGQSSVRKTYECSTLTRDFSRL